MKKFVFRLQTVLDLREQAEQSARAALGHAQRELDDVETRIADRESECARVLADLPPNLTPEERASVRAWADQIAKEISWMKTEREAHLREVDFRRAEMVRTKAERRMATRARENAFANYRAEVQRREQNTLDEIATVRYEMMRRAA